MSTVAHVRSTSSLHFFFFFFNDTATTEIYTLSLHDALPISPPRRTPRGARAGRAGWHRHGGCPAPPRCGSGRGRRDRKSTRLNSSHGYISYAVFCLKKKKNKKNNNRLGKRQRRKNARATAYR